MGYILLYYALDYTPITEFFSTIELAKNRIKQLLPDTHTVIYECDFDNKTGSLELNRVE